MPCRQPDSTTSLTEAGKSLCAGVCWGGFTRAVFADDAEVISLVNRQVEAGDHGVIFPCEGSVDAMHHDVVGQGVGGDFFHVLLLCFMGWCQGDVLVL